MYEAIQTGFNNASGNYFYWLNSDDFLLNENSVSNLMKVLNKKKYEWVICKISYQNLMNLQ